MFYKRVGVTSFLYVNLVPLGHKFVLRAWLKEVLHKSGAINPSVDQSTLRSFMSRPWTNFLREPDPLFLAPGARLPNLCTTGQNGECIFVVRPSLSWPLSDCFDGCPSFLWSTRPGLLTCVSLVACSLAGTGATRRRRGDSQTVLAPQAFRYVCRCTKRGG